MEMPDIQLTDEQFTRFLALKKDVMTTEEAAVYTAVSKQNLELARLNGGGPRYSKIGRLVRYRREALDAWLVENEQGHTAENAE